MSGVKLTRTDVVVERPPRGRSAPAADKREQPRASGRAARHAWPLLLSCGALACAPELQTTSTSSLTYRHEPSQAAKAAIQAGKVTTRSGAVIRKASIEIAEDAALNILGDSAAADGSEQPMAAAALIDAGSVTLPAVEGPTAQSAKPKSARVLTAAGEAALKLTLEAAESVTRRSTAASRAAKHQNARRDGIGSEAQVHQRGANSLMGQYMSTADGTGKAKHFSKKNKAGTAAAAAAARGLGLTS